MGSNQARILLRRDPEEMQCVFREELTHGPERLAVSLAAIVAVQCSLSESSVGRQ